MTIKKRILVVGTGDTKSEELEYIRLCIEEAGAAALIMDVGVLGDPEFQPDYSKHDVAKWANTSNQKIIAYGNENEAMTKQAEGASALALHLAKAGSINGMIAIGGTMATDLALDVALALPFGFPKMIVSTIAFSALIPPDRLAPDVMMSLWTAGLYGLNPYCKTALKQAAYAVVGTTQAKAEEVGKPVVAITSLGSASLKYTKTLYPALQARGFDVAIFHTTGMGGRSMEAINQSNGFAAIFDFSLVEVSNGEFGSMVASGDMRLQGHENDTTPRIIAAGGVTLVDFQAWSQPPMDCEHRKVHLHNRLIASLALNANEREHAARLIGEKINRLKAPKTVILTTGIDEWDKEGGPFHDPDGLLRFNAALSESLDSTASQINISAHINAIEFSNTALKVFDDWLSNGTVKAN